jgi:hypothetical protein
LKIKIRYLCFALLFLISCENNRQQKIIANLVQSPLSSNKNNDEVAMPEIELDHDFFDFGEMNQDELVSIDFKLKNIGNAPLLIRSAKASCGCTVPEWPREPVVVGDIANIKVTFNSGTRSGKQNKTVTLVTNAIPSIKVLTIKGVVLSP